jgi:hypothetical protein
MQMPAARAKLYHALLSNGPQRPHSARRTQSNKAVYEGGKSSFVDSVIQQVVSTPRKGSSAPVVVAAAVEAKSVRQPKPKQLKKQRPQTARPCRAKKTRTAPSVSSAGSSFADAPRSGFYTGQMSYRKYDSVAKEHHKQLKTKKQLWAQYTFLHGKSPPKAKAKQTMKETTLSADPALRVVGTSLATPEHKNRSASMAVAVDGDFSSDEVVVRAQKALALEQVMLGLSSASAGQAGGTSGEAASIADALNESASAADEEKEAFVADEEPVAAQQEQPDSFTYEYPEWWKVDADMVWPGQSTYDAEYIRNRPSTAPAAVQHNWR